MARRFPRDQEAAVYQIMRSCERTSFAEQATYSYPRGGQNVTGPSIRLAEEMARQWGNLDFGVRELDRSKGESLVEAYCYDLQTNVRRSTTFNVKHWRDTKNGGYALTDERDIYEAVANFAARRLRAAILAVIPQDVTEAATKACHTTLSKRSGKSVGEAVRQLVYLFGRSHGVTADMIAKQIGRPLDMATAEDVVSLQSIFNSLKDNMSAAADWFEMGEERSKDVTARLKGQSSPSSPTTKPPATKNVAQGDTDGPGAPPAAPPKAKQEPAETAPVDQEADADPSGDPALEAQLTRLRSLITSGGLGDTDAADYIELVVDTSDGVIDAEAMKTAADELAGFRASPRKEGELSERAQFVSAELALYRQALKEGS